MTNASEWLAAVDEPAIEPDLPIIDTHHHLWDRPGSRYVLDELVADTAAHNVRQTVFVECSSMYRADGPEELKPIGETEFVRGIAAQSASGAYGEMRTAAGIVGTADLMLGGDVAAVLEAQIEASPMSFRGIRHRTAWAEPGVQPRASGPDPHLMANATFREGFARLDDYGLSFDAWLYHPQLPEFVDLAAAFPNTTVILNHLGGPLGVGPYAGRREEIFTEWQRSIAAVAAMPNVVMKVGGIQMPVNGFGWHERERPPTSDELLEVNRDWYLHAIEQFGPDRCTFESNFPVDRASCSYTVLWNQFKKLTTGFSVSERAAMFHDTAARVYRLDGAA
jgi:predicted TIM-barrel fold metal-dependent hydrolase